MPVQARRDSMQSGVGSEYYDAFSDASDESRSPLSREESQRQDNLASKYCFTRFRQRCGDLVNHEWVQLGIILLIIINAIMMGIATFPIVRDNPDTDHAFQVVDKVFLIIFTVELALQLIYRSWRLFLDGWLVFDFFIVIFSWSFESLQIIRAFRIFRALRLITRIKVLRDLVVAIGSVLPRMTAIFALLGLIFYIFAVLFTTLFKDLPLENGNFQSLDNSFFSLFEMMTMEWADVTRELMTYHSWAWAPSVTFVLLSGFVVFNLIIAVVCDAVAFTDTEATEEEDKSIEDELSQAQIRVKILTAQVNDMQDNQRRLLDMLEQLADAVGASVPLPQSPSD